MEHGDQFHFAMTIFGRQGDADFPNLATPFVTCASFALEAYFKVLANIERRLLPLHTHNLKHLFADISDASQRRLEAEWSATALPRLARQMADPNLPRDMPRVQTFQQALEMAATSFVDWRYATRKDNRFFHLPDLVPMARRVIVDQRPELGRTRKRMVPLDGPLPPEPE